MRTSEDYILVKKEKVKNSDIDETLFKLLKLARKKPKDMLELMDIEGLGEYKAKKFGEVFLEVIDVYNKM